MERTAYPRFKRIISERELAQFFTPDEAEITWAAKRTHERPGSLLTLLVLLKSCARLGYFPGLEEIPVVVIARVRTAAGLPEDATPGVEERTAKRYRSWIREYLGLVHDPLRARGIAAAAMEEAAPVRASVVDLVNVALEEIVRAGLELPGFFHAGPDGGLDQDAGGGRDLRPDRRAGGSGSLPPGRAAGRAGRRAPQPVRCDQGAGAAGDVVEVSAARRACRSRGWFRRCGELGRGRGRGQGQRVRGAGPGAVDRRDTGCLRAAADRAAGMRGGQGQGAGAR
ncbi:DUF4158 domain-containing protein [Streptomyces zhaozhouensis]|uniref:DUF4158 domain-containing protein n=1 Tax=Streptomyces zhaozhouensis TaxID=1300267 RepID=UPI0034E0AC10